MKSMMKIMLAGLLLAGAWRCWGLDSPLLDLRFIDLGWGKLSKEVWNPPVDQTVVRIQYEHRIVLPPTKECIVFYFVEKFYEKDYLLKVNAIYQEIRKICPMAEIYPKMTPIKPAKDSAKEIVWQEIAAELPVKTPLPGDQLIDWWTLQNCGMSQLSIACFYMLDDTLKLRALIRENSFAQGTQLLAGLAKRLHSSLSEFPLLDRYSVYDESEYQGSKPSYVWGDEIHLFFTPDPEKITIVCPMDLAFSVKLPREEAIGTHGRPERLVRKKFTCRFKPDTACLVLLLTAQGDSMTSARKTIAGQRARLEKIIHRYVSQVEIQGWDMQSDVTLMYQDVYQVQCARAMLVLLPSDPSLVAKIVEETKTVMGANAEKNTKVVFGVRNGELVWQRWFDAIWKDLLHPTDEKANQPPRRIRYFCSSDLDTPYRLIYDSGMIRLPLAFYGFSPDAFEVTGEFEAIVQE